VIYVALVGVTLILVRGTIFRPLQRFWPALFGCSQCVGMWVGLAAGAFGFASMDHGRAMDAVLVGGATSVLSIAADGVLMKLLGDPEQTR
jgi:hypothetical protein